MKKFTLLIAALLLVSFGAFGVETALSAEISGDASMTFGTNLQTGATGFANASSADLEITIVAEATEAYESESAVYGWIELSDFAWVANADGTGVTAPGVSAKVVLGPAYVTITDAANGLDFVNLGMGMFLKDGDPENGTGLDVDPAEEFSGMAVGADLGILSFEVGVTSQYDWKVTGTTKTYTEVIGTGTEKVVAGVTYYDVTGIVDVAPLVKGDRYTKVTVATDGANTNNEYNFYGTVSLAAVENLGLDLMANYESVTKDVGLGAKVSYTIGLGDMFLMPVVGIDVKTEGWAWELGAGVQFSFGGDDFEGSLFGSTVDYTVVNGVSVSVLLGETGATANATQLLATFFDGALIPVVDLVAYGQIDINANANWGWEYGTKVSADLGIVAPYVQVQSGGTDVVHNVGKLWVGTDVSIIENVTFTLAYESADLTVATPDLGFLTFKTAIEF